MIVTHVNGIMQVLCAEGGGLGFGLDWNGHFMEGSPVGMSLAASNGGTHNAGRTMLQIVRIDAIVDNSILVELVVANLHEALESAGSGLLSLTA